MRRSAVILGAVAALVGGLVAPAHAALAPVVADTMWVDDATSGGPWIDDLPCGGTSAPTTTNADASLTINSSSAPDPNLPGSTRTWGYTFYRFPTESDSYAAMISAGSSKALSTFSLDVSGASASGQAVIYYWNADGTRWAGRSPLTRTAGAAWTLVDASTATYTWTETDSTGAVIPQATPQPDATIAGFVAAHGEAARGYDVGIGFGCDGLAFRFQNETLNTPSGPQPVDFEALTNQLDIVRSTGVLTQGSGAVLHGSAQFGSAPAGASASPAQLQARAYGQASFRTVASVSSGGYVDDWYPKTCDAKYTVCRDYFAPVSVKPSLTTSYRWYYPASDAVTAAYSPVTTVQVRTRIVPSWVSSIHRGARFSVSGRTFPAKPGAVVTMWGKVGTTTYKLGTARVGTNGAFSVSGTASRSGTWAVWFTVPAGKGNVAGTSPIRRYSVR